MTGFLNWCGGPSPERACLQKPRSWPTSLHGKPRDASAHRKRRLAAAESMALFAPWTHMAELAPGFGAEVTFLTPERFCSIALPTYPEIRLAMPAPGQIRRLLEATKPTHIHIATEGPLGLATRRACLRDERAFTTSYHTRFPEYLSARCRVPKSLAYRALRAFHNGGRGVMVSTTSLEAELAARGFRNLLRWTRGGHGVVPPPS